MQMQINFNKPYIANKQSSYILEAVQSRHISGDGIFTKKCHSFLEKELSVPKVLLTTSCTHALDMSAMLLGLKNGDEVIVADFTFVSTVNAFVLRGAKPIFCDIRPDTLNLDETLLEGLITPRTRAIYLVHYAGVGCEMDSIMEIAGHHDIPVVEDNAHGLFGKYHGKHLGTFGCMATQSFHETKNFTCGEGGALLINDPKYFEEAEIIREKGTNRSRFFRGLVDKYTWVSVGSSYLPSDILAAMLLAQLEEKDFIQSKRQTIWATYRKELSDWSESNQVLLPTVPDECDQTYHMFYMLMPDLDTRTKFINYLKEQGIMAVFHYLPLNLSDMGRKYGGREGDCPVTEKISDQLVRLPFYNDLGQVEQFHVIEAIRKFAC
jgi:dTDP-4-amino-4,6-dideoxygalactose transaminase